MDGFEENINIENLETPIEDSMNEEEYKKETDSETQIFGINTTIPSQKMTIMNAIREALINLQTQIDLTSYVSYITTSKIGMNLYFDTLYEYPELFYPDLTISCTYYTSKSTGNITRYYLKVSYLYSSSVINSMKASLTAKVNEIKNNYLYNASGNLEKEYIIHDYLLENCTYDTSGNLPTSAHTSYAVLITGKAVCDGYSKAAKLLFNECGIDAGIITSDSMNHAWNYIKMNGYYYYLDITWDDPVPETYVSRYSYFNRNSQEMINGNHTWVTGNYPVSTSTVFSFLRSYSKLTRSNDKLYYYDSGAKALYEMTLEGKNKTNVRSNFTFNNNLEIIGLNNNLYYVKQVYNSTDKKNYNALISYNLSTKAEETLFQTVGNIKKIYKKNFNIVVQYTASQSTTTVSATTIDTLMRYDTNRDGVLNTVDVANISSKYNKKVGESGYIAAWDFNSDGIIDIYDIVKISANL
ncbi:Transglutaminase-like superfamily protein [Clostridium sp. DSM 8431]|uniref:transglutaminase domain-containing protein n=1 Tax=Clostridium sp. DSM 8431 TaxID=1761781 RepID=UPI0008EC7066|nr:transglutaminase domain-containing protein [Clostridium sp. DSM 8431]SFU37959.1 Transglutaminase-like superfamily protein [Clostridium sp. DSM 8431]